jgi:serine/threonine-protein kinase
MAFVPAPAAPALFAGRYQMLARLGGGTFGEVYQAVDTHQGDVVAVKLLKLINPLRPWQEAEILTHLASPYTLRVRNADIAAGQPYIVTELAHYGSAAQGMVPVGVPPDQAVRWIRAACRGAARTHDAGLLHRDIKPENIFLTAASDAVLGDFGIAEMLDPTGHAGWGGTAQTMAPEVAAGGLTSIRSDVYSLGASLYALLAGKFAHQGPDDAAIRAAVVAGPGPDIRDVAPHVPQVLASRVRQAMAPHEADRFPDATAFDASLGLPAPQRAWRRTDEHAPGHATCYRGAKAGSPDITVCAVPAGSRFAVEAYRQPCGHRVNAGFRAAGPASALPRNLRTAMAAVG